MRCLEVPWRFVKRWSCPGPKVIGWAGSTGAPARGNRKLIGPTQTSMVDNCRNQEHGDLEDAVCKGVTGHAGQVRAP